MGLTNRLYNEKHLTKAVSQAILEMSKYQNFLETIKNSGSEESWFDTVKAKVAKATDRIL